MVPQKVYARRTCVGDCRHAHGNRRFVLDRRFPVLVASLEFQARPPAIRPRKLVARLVLRIETETGRLRIENETRRFRIKSENGNFRNLFGRRESTAEFAAAATASGGGGK